MDFVISKWLSNGSRRTLQDLAEILIIFALEGKVRAEVSDPDSYEILDSFVDIDFSINHPSPLFKDAAVCKSRQLWWNMSTDETTSAIRL